MTSVMPTTDNSLIIDLNIDSNSIKTGAFIKKEIDSAYLEIEVIEETIASVDNLSPHCDKIDYALAAGSGVLCGIIDILFGGAPKASILGNETDKWIDCCVKKFAKLNGWDSKGDNTIMSAIRYLGKEYKVNYDQRGCGDSAGEKIFGLTPSNHHFKSLGHNPTLVGLFFSILDQFTNQSHFISDGQLIALQVSDNTLYGKNVISKLFCGFINWFGHIMSDIAGSESSRSKGNRGMGIPAPIWSWINSVIAIKHMLNIPVFQFEKELSKTAQLVFLKGGDFRFATAQSIPVVLNELIVRFFYSFRRYLSIRKSNAFGEISGEEIWDRCKPCQNPTLTRMLTIAHASFCTIDIVDAAIRGGGSIVFALRINVVGITRLNIAIFNEIKLHKQLRDAKHQAELALRDKTIIEDYIKGLNELAEFYNDVNFVDFGHMLDESKNAKLTFLRSVEVAESRGVGNHLQNINDINKFFSIKND